MLNILGGLAILCSCILLPAQPARSAACCDFGAPRVIVELNGPALALSQALHGPHTNLSRLHAYLQSPAAERYRRALATYQRNEIAYLRARSISLIPQFQFQTLLNGFSATVSDVDLARLSAMPNVKSVTRVHRFRVQLDRAVPLVHAPEAWTSLGGGENAGKGQRIAIIDTGIDINNPCFDDKGLVPTPGGPTSDTSENLLLTNKKVIVARAFGPSSANSYDATDRLGHGTAVASVAACDFNTRTPDGKTLSGVAPAASLMSYNISPDGSGCATNEQIIRGFEAAVMDKANVINLSFGGPAGDLKYEKAQVDAIHAAVAAGVTVAIANGNAGPEAESVGSPGIYPDAIGVGASTNSRDRAPTVTASVPGEAPVVFLAVPGEHPFSNKIGPKALVDVGLGRKPGDDPSHKTADDFAGKELHGKIAVIARGSISFDLKINNAASAGAVGVIVYNNRGGAELLSMGTPTATLPATLIGQNDGARLLDLLAAHPDATATIDPNPSDVDVKPNVLASFSSRGYGSVLGIKPDLVAPGQGIITAVQRNVASGITDPSGFAMLNGTSFSAPMVAGAAALFLQSHPGATPSQVKSGLMDTANMSDVTLDEHGTVPTVTQSGAGLLDVQAAGASTAFLLPSSLSFGGVNAGYNGVDAELATSLSDFGGGSGPWSVSVHVLHGGVGVNFSAPPQAILPPEGHVPVTLHLSAARTVKAGDYDGYLVLQGSHGTLHLPFFVHLANLPVIPGSILLVDNTLSRFSPAPPSQEVGTFYQRAVSAIGRQFTYWRESEQGPPTLADMKHSTGVIYFTGSNVNDFGPTNGNSEAQMGPLTEPDEVVMRQYLADGGNIFLTGMGAAVTGLNTDWLKFVFGASTTDVNGQPASYSVYDNSFNDAQLKGGISPPQPSAVADNIVKNGGIFAGMKPIDLSTKGDGAGDNTAIPSLVAANLLCPIPGHGVNPPRLLGVIGLKAFAGTTRGGGVAYGHPALKTAKPNLADGPPGVGVVSSDEPSLSHTPTFAGRSILFSFGFEGINDNSGFATRSDVLRHIFKWFADHPSVKVGHATLTAGQVSRLTVKVQAPIGVRVVQYRWQIGKTMLKATARPTRYRFPRKGTYRVRVQIVDSLGHNAVSAVTKITVY